MVWILLAIPLLAMERPEDESSRVVIKTEMFLHTDIGNSLSMRCVSQAIGPNIEEMEKNNPYISYGKSGRAWLKVVSGVNYGGFCKNNACAAKGYVYIPVGKVEFLIQNGGYCHPSKCPQCKNDVEIRDWGFSNCCFQIIWRKPNGRGVRDWRKADEQYYNLSMDDLGKAEYIEVKLKFLPLDTDLSLLEDL